MRLRHAVLSVLVLVLLVPAATRAEKFAGEFMAVGGGARALGMGGAFAAVAADVSTVYWNPAGISGMVGRQAIAMHSERFGDLVNYNFAAYAQPASFLDAEREASWGLGLIHLGISGNIITNNLLVNDIDGDGNPRISELTDADGNPIDPALLPRESENNFALLGSFGMKTSAGRIGGTLKIIYTDAIAGFSSTGIGIDLGFLREDLFFRNLNFGAKLQDATGTYISWSTGTNEFITPMLKVGSAYRIDSDRLNGALLIAVDTDVFFDGRTVASQFWTESVAADLHVGLELHFQEKVMVRGGVDAENPTAGAGLRLGFLGFDYAYLHHDDFEATHRVSVLGDF